MSGPPLSHFSLPFLLCFCFCSLGQGRGKENGCAILAFFDNNATVMRKAKDLGSKKVARLSQNLTSERQSRVNLIQFNSHECSRQRERERAYTVMQQSTFKREGRRGQSVCKQQKANRERFIEEKEIY